MMSQELKILTEALQSSFTQILDYIQSEAIEQELHEVEENLFRKLQQLGLLLLHQMLQLRGVGRQNESVFSHCGEKLAYHGIEKIKYVSIFGELEMGRAYY